jgi:tetrahydromethanopterin S-methyltransferase subunit E
MRKVLCENEGGASEKVGRRNGNDQSLFCADFGGAFSGDFNLFGQYEFPVSEYSVFR